jgi:hypothetical protein
MSDAREGQRYWASQSPVTSPPPAAATAIDELPVELAALREASSQLVFHYRAGGDFAEKGVPPERSSEINDRYADVMFTRLLKRGEPALSRRRPAPDRVVGCCRDATVLFLALTRHKGIPARARVGFAAYIIPGWLVDHVIAEVWDEAEGRWRMVDPEMESDWVPEVNGRQGSWLDLTGEEFVTGARAWQAARAGTSDPDKHVVSPDLDVPALRGWPYLAHNAIHDLAALSKTEMILWDVWGIQQGHGDGMVPEADAKLLDEVCALTAAPGTSPEVIADLAQREELRVPQVVTSLDPLGGPPSQVDVTRALPLR